MEKGGTLTEKGDIVGEGGALPEKGGIQPEEQGTQLREDPAGGGEDTAEGGNPATEWGDPAEEGGPSWRRWDTIDGGTQLEKGEPSCRRGDPDEEEDDPDRGGCAGGCQGPAHWRTPPQSRSSWTQCGAEGHSACNPPQATPPAIMPGSHYTMGAWGRVCPRPRGPGYKVTTHRAPGRTFAPTTTVCSAPSRGQSPRGPTWGQAAGLAGGPQSENVGRRRTQPCPS